MRSDIKELFTMRTQMQINDGDHTTIIVDVKASSIAMVQLISLLMLDHSFCQDRRTRLPSLLILRSYLLPGLYYHLYSYSDRSSGLAHKHPTHTLSSWLDAITSSLWFSNKFESMVEIMGHDNTDASDFSMREIRLDSLKQFSPTEQ